MGGGKSTTTYAPKLNGIQIQSSVYGSAITRGWGTFRCAPTLLWYGDFQAIAVRSQTRAGGKGGGGATQTNVTYNYKAALMLGICAGPINSIRTVYKDKSVFTSLSAAGLSLATGAIGQAVWGHLTTNHPTEAIGYSGIAYAYSSAYDLSEQATIGNHSFEVVTNARVSGKDDCSPKQIVEEALGMVPLFPTAAIGDLTDWGNYCLAAGLLLSPVLDAQVRAADFLAEILKATNSDCYTSGGKLKVFSYGDTAVTGNSVTWTPDLSPVYALTDDDFIADAGEEAVSIDISRGADAYNVVQIGFLDRANQYNAQVMPGTDSASIDQHGERKADVEDLHCICDKAVAKTVADLRVQRTANMRATYHFRLSDDFGLLEPSDLVTLTSGDLNGVLVRLTRVDEDAANGELLCEAEEMLVGTGSTIGGTTQDGGGFQPDYEVDPGDAADPVVVNPPRQLTNGAYEAWIGLTGGDNWGGAEVWTSLDGDTYQLMGRVESKARFGTTSSSIGAVADPDSTSALEVDMAASHGKLNSATQAEVDAFANLAMVGTEVLAFRDAVLLGPDVYSIDYFRRGLFGTTVASHAVGQPFVRLDEALYVFPYRVDQIGSSVYVKFRSFNVYGRGYQDLDTLDEYLFTLTPSGATFSQVDWGDVEPPAPDVLNDWNVLRRTGGGDYLGDLAATVGARTGTNLYRTDGLTVLNQADVRTIEGTSAAFTGQTAWATYGTYTPGDVAPRVVAGLDSSGDLARNLTTSRLNSSNVMRRTSGGLYTGDLAATVGARSGTNLYRTDGTTVLNQADIRTIEGTAAAFTGQGALATRSDVLASHLQASTNFGNLIREPEFLDESAWTRNGTGSVYSTTDTTVTTTLGARKAAKVDPALSTSQYDIFNTGDIPISRDGRLYFRIDVAALAGFNGAAFVQLRCYDRAGATLGYSSLGIFANGLVTPLAADQVGTLQGVLTPLAGTVRAVVQLVVNWDTNWASKTKAGAVYFTAASLTYTASLNRNIFRDDTSTLLTDLLAVTSLGTSAAFSGQTAWATYGAYSPTDVAPRVMAGLDTNGDVIRPIPGTTLDTSNILRRTGGGSFIGDLAATVGARAGTNLYRTDGTTVLNQADVRTIEGTAAGFTGQGALATLSTVNANRAPMPVSNNLIRDPTFEDSTAWSIVSGGNSVSYDTSSIVRTTLGAIRGVKVDGTQTGATANSIARVLEGSLRPIDPTLTYRIGAIARLTAGFNGYARNDIRWYKADGSASTIRSADFVNLANRQTTPSAADETVSAFGVFTPPADAAYVRVGGCYLAWGASAPAGQAYFVGHIMLQAYALNGGALLRDNLTTPLSDSLVVTSIGTAAAFTGQGALATLSTINNSALLNPGIVTPSRVSLGDTANMFPDPNMIDSALFSTYAGAPVFSLNATSATFASQRRLLVSADASEVGVQTSLIWGAEAQRQYFFKFQAGNSTGSGDHTARVSVLWLSVSNAGVETLLSEVVIGTSSGGSGTEIKAVLTAPASTRAMRIVFYRQGGGTVQASFASPIIRRATDSDILAANAARLGTHVTRENGTTVLTDLLAVTSLGTAASITGQGTGATASTLQALNATDGRRLLQSLNEAEITDTFTYANDTDFGVFWSTLSGSGEYSYATDTTAPGGRYVRIGDNSGNDERRIMWAGDAIPYDPTALYEVGFIVRRTSGAGALFAGLAGVAENGTTYINTTGANSAAGSQHYLAASSISPPSTWTTYRGYVQGHSATPATGNRTDPAAPGQMYTGVAYVRPIAFVNVTAQAGETDLALVWIRKLPGAAATQNRFSLGGSFLYRADATTALSDASVVTSLGTASAIAGQTAWATYSTHTPANIAPRVAAGFDANGDLARDIPSSRLDSSNVLRRTGGGLFTGALAATVGATSGTNLYRTDGVTVLTQAEVRTAEGVAASIAGQGTLATLNQAAWGTNISGRPTELTDGRVAAGLDASGDLNRNISSSRLDSSNALRRTGGGLYTGDLAATVGAVSGTNLYRTDGTTVLTQAEVRTAEGTASAISGQGPLATSPLTEAKVKGRFRGAYASEAAYNADGPEDGDTFVDQGVWPPRLMGRQSGSNFAISETGIQTLTSTNVDSSSGTMTEVWASALAFAVTSTSFFAVQFGLEVQTTPSQTRSSSGSSAPSGSWEIWECPPGGNSASVGARKILDGAWGSSIVGGGGGAANITSFDVASTGDGWSKLSDQYKFKWGGLTVFALKMTGAAPNLIDAVGKIAVFVQRN